MKCVFALFALLIAASVQLTSSSLASSSASSAAAEDARLLRGSGNATDTIAYALFCRANPDSFICNLPEDLPDSPPETLPPLSEIFAQFCAAFPEATICGVEPPESPLDIPLVSVIVEQFCLAIPTAPICASDEEPEYPLPIEILIQFCETFPEADICPIAVPTPIEIFCRLNPESIIC